jgi:predicted transcriptional regulator
MAKDGRQLFVWLSDDVHDYLERVAEREDRSKAYIARRLIMQAAAEQKLERPQRAA